jgi:hypothetical protein
VSSVVRFEAPAAAVRAAIDFLRPMAGRPYSYGYEPAAHEPPPTAAFETHRVLILNARTAPRRLPLDEHGATLVRHRSAVRDFYDDAQLIDRYYREAAAVIRATTGAHRVEVFDRGGARMRRPRCDDCEAVELRRVTMRSCRARLRRRNRAFLVKHPRNSTTDAGFALLASFAYGIRLPQYFEVKNDSDG